MRDQGGSPEKQPKSYSYKSRKERIRLRIIDGMDSICASKGPEAQSRAQYYDTYDYKKTDPEGSYTGVPTHQFGQVPVQDADDL
ncbi:MAG: hypothetical protein ACI4RV_05595 [Eubacteriales bacterium]